MSSVRRIPRLTRRQAIALGLGTGAYVLVGCSDDSNGPATEAGGATGTGGSTTSDGGDSASCVLAPEQTEGPYYIDDSMVRSDVTDGQDGTPLELRLTVEDASSCRPIRGATVEIWHANALGEYSGFDASGTFLRGGQRSDGDGVVAFRTIYPGWYQGRATHIHVKVHAGGDVVHTGQLYFDEAVNSAVFRRAPYSSRGEPTTTNATDGIYSEGGRQSTLALSPDGQGYVGRLTLGVRV